MGELKKIPTKYYLPPFYTECAEGYTVDLSELTEEECLLWLKGSGEGTVGNLQGEVE